MTAKKFKPGQTFTATTKRQSKGEHWYDSPRFHLMKKGETGYFQKGKRIYFCEILGLLQTTTGRYDIDMSIRYWQFTYKVKILED